MTEAFCDEIVAEMENFGQWSGGKSEVNINVTLWTLVSEADILYISRGCGFESC